MILEWFWRIPGFSRNSRIATNPAGRIETPSSIYQGRILSSFLTIQLFSSYRDRYWFTKAEIKEPRQCTETEFSFWLCYTLQIHADQCISLTKWRPMVFSTPSDAILWAIYTDMHGSATRGADLESGQLRMSRSVSDNISYICLLCSWYQHGTHFSYD